MAHPNATIKNMQKRSRRWFLASLAVNSAAQWGRAETTGKGRAFPSVAARYADPATEFVVLRLTSPQFTSMLPLAGNRGITARSLLYASDQTGNWQAFQMDLKTWQSKQLTEAADLDPSSLALSPNDRGFLHRDGTRLVETPFSGAKPRERCHIPAEVETLPGVRYGDDGQHAVLVSKKADRFRLHLANLRGGSLRTLIESPTEIREPLLRPHHDSLVYSMGGEVWSIDFNGQHNRRLPLAAGETPQARWTTGGRSLLYLNHPDDPRKLTALREFVPEGDTDTRIADTTQFVRFQGNSDSSVFIGASGSKAAPYLLLLTRTAKRELALAEHRSSSPSLVNPTFAPNSQFVVFVSDRHGKPAIYWIAVEKLVSETDGT